MITCILKKIVINIFTQMLVKNREADTHAESLNKVSNISTRDPTQEFEYLSASHDLEECIKVR